MVNEDGEWRSVLTRGIYIKVVSVLVPPLQIQFHMFQTIFIKCYNTMLLRQSLNLLLNTFH